MRTYVAVMQTSGIDTTKCSDIAARTAFPVNNLLRLPTLARSDRPDAT